jgi:NADPH:quinone reductase
MKTRGRQRLQGPDMRVVEIEGGKGPADALMLGERDTPTPGSGEILIRVRAAGINRPDILQRKGLYPPPPGASDIMGLEVAGEVEAAGADVNRWRPGDRVCALLGGGGYADYALVDARHVLPVPAGLDFIQAAGLPETAFTVFTNVFEGGRLKAGETLLVHGATSGIGVMAIQAARAAGARVIATSRSADKAKAARALGADVSINASDGRFLDAVRDAGGADVVLDMVGAAYAEQNLQALNPGGRWVVIAFQSGHLGEVDLSRLMRGRLTLTGSTLRARDADEKARLAEAVETTLWPWVANGDVRPVVDRVFPLEQAGAAHAYLESGAHTGKVVLTT